MFSHIYFIQGYIYLWWLQHFNLQKDMDTYSKAPGFGGTGMALHYYAQHHDLLKLRYIYGEKISSLVIILHIS